MRRPRAKPPIAPATPPDSSGERDAALRPASYSDAGLSELFLDMIAAEQGASANTLDAYRRDLADLSHYLSRRRKSIASADTEALRGYLADLDTRGLASSSVARRLSALRHLFRFLLSERIRVDDPAAILSGPKRGRGLPKVLSIADVDRLLTCARQEADATEGAAGLRAARLDCLLEVLYATGLRVSELVALPLTAARGDARMIVVRGKGDKERLVPLNDSSKQAMTRYLAAAAAATKAAGDKKAAAGSKWLFPSFGESGHLTRQHFARDLKDLAARAGLAARLVSPHVLRHAFASHLLHNGADLRIVQTLLGHSDISTTQIYTHVVEDRLKSLVRDLHPLAEG
jgi:integrase/recombinase XerD